MRHIVTFPALTACGFVMFLGCGNQTAPTPSAKSVAQPSVPEAEKQTNAKSGKKQATQRQPADAPPPFSPPFPNRSDPFKRPNFNQMVKTNSASQEDIKLRGFINVNGMQALLAINGRVQLVQEGERRQGVQVIKISPPNVILQKGRVRWTQRLFDTKTPPAALRAGLPTTPKTPF